MMFYRVRWSISATVVVGMAMGLIVARPSVAQEHSDQDSDENFSLQKGHGVPVCEAYLELLNQTKFTETPFCGRPEEGPVKGFEHLEGHAMDLGEIWPLFTQVWEFMRFNDQHHVEKFFHPNRDSTKSVWNAEPTTRDVIAEGLSLGWLRVWNYASPVDIGNDGSPLKVITWQGYGATGSAKRCGSDYALRAWIAPYIDQRAFVLTADGKSLDEARTREIFGASAAPAQGRPATQVPGGADTGGVAPFHPLADSIGIFKYQGRYYIQTEDLPKTKDVLPSVRVLLRERGITRQVCALRPQSVPVPDN
jgi:hypothetical protein